MNDVDPKNLYWGVLNRSDLRQLSGITFDTVVFILKLIPEKQIEHWMAWHEGLEKWMPVNKIEILRSAIEDPEQELAPVGVSINSKVGLNLGREVDRRRQERISKNIHVEIKSQSGEVFRATTTNISKSGMLLNSPIPTQFGKNFCCRLILNNDSRLDIFAALVRSSGKDERLRVKFLDVSHPKMLNAWLEEKKTS